MFGLQLPSPHFSQSSQPAHRSSCVIRFRISCLVTQKELKREEESTNLRMDLHLICSRVSFGFLGFTFGCPKSGISLLRLFASTLANPWANGFPHTLESTSDETNPSLVVFVNCFFKVDIDSCFSANWVAIPFLKKPPLSWTSFAAATLTDCRAMQWSRKSLEDVVARWARNGDNRSKTFSRATTSPRASWASVWRILILREGVVFVFVFVWIAFVDCECLWVFFFFLFFFLSPLNRVNALPPYSFPSSFFLLLLFFYIPLIGSSKNEECKLLREIVPRFILKDSCGPIFSFLIFRTSWRESA